MINRFISLRPNAVVFLYVILYIFYSLVVKFVRKLELWFPTNTNVVIIINLYLQFSLIRESMLENVTDKAESSFSEIIVLQYQSNIYICIYESFKALITIYFKKYFNRTGYFNSYSNYYNSFTADLSVFNFWVINQGERIIVN